jgi:hypothetical protein
MIMVDEPDYEVITTVAELVQVAEAIAGGAFSTSVFVIGPGGTAKSSTLRRVLPPSDLDDPLGDARCKIRGRLDDLGSRAGAVTSAVWAPQIGLSGPARAREGTHWVRGMVSAPALYMDLYRNRDRLIVADDCHNLYADPQMRTLLKQINETEPRKTVTWNKLNAEMRAEGIPPTFETTSRFVLIGNDWRTLDKDLAAVEDRVHLFKYDPTPGELLRYAETWFPDKVVLRYAADALQAGRGGRISLRDLVKAAEFRSSGVRPWQGYLDRRLSPVDAGEVSDDMQAVLDWAAKFGKATFTAGDVGRSLTRFKRRPDRRARALDGLVERGLIHPLPTPPVQSQGGRPVEAMYGLGARPHNPATPGVHPSGGGVLGLWGYADSPDLIPPESWPKRQPRGEEESE